MKLLTFDELRRWVQEADSMKPPTKEEILFDEAVVKALGYYPDWHDMKVQ